MKLPDGWKEKNLCDLLDPETRRKIGLILKNGGGARELFPILEPHRDDLEKKGVDCRFLAFLVAGDYAITVEKPKEK
tara:strand:+ start:1232 stop:1462 length:231 start_codon:yes stop_codon:yes gene_type:complete